jgi:dTDP-4-dehydrorhamnose 3,5-epimerase-like enzyme
MNNLYAIKDISIVEFPYFCEENGSLVIMEVGNVVPFEIARVFLVKADSGSVRGKHAHYECFQMLQCINGSIDVTCTDGEDSADFTLDTPKLGLMIPPGIWATQTYTDSDSSLIVLCDQLYSESDYIRNYDEYLQYRDSLI